MNFVDNLLNNITMYRTVLYYLIGLLCVALVASFFKLLPFSPLALLLTTLILLVISLISNAVFAQIFNAKTNVESVYISALILALIISPIKIPHDLIFFGWAALWTMASKFIVTINKKHIFNPVAFGVWLASIGISQFATWWVGTGIMLPFVIIGGFLVVRKIKREDLVFSFLVAALLAISFFTILAKGSLTSSIQKALLQSPLFFFAFVILTEPLTTPPTKTLQTIYGALIGVMFTPQFQLLNLTTTPESALLIGNLFSYLISPKAKLFLHLSQKAQLTQDIFDFVFDKPKKFSFTPGQYMEWTVDKKGSDTRGNRRYFTLASSPTENKIIIGIKFSARPSSFKKTLFSLIPGDEIIASQIAGDFVLPENPNHKLVFLAGGIGITPFRSMIKYLIDTNQKRDIVLLYAAKTEKEFVYTDVFFQTQKLGVRVFYTITDEKAVPQDWQGGIGRITKEMLNSVVPDYRKRHFYISGPHNMVSSFENLLKELNIKSNQVKTDYFPGFV